MKHSPKLKVLIIGCGNIAGGFDDVCPENVFPYTHAGAYHLHSGFSIEACVDPDTRKLSAFSERWQVPISAINLEQLSAQSGSFDVISVCSPTACHAADLKEVIALKPRLIFCEKPVTYDSEITTQIVEACNIKAIKLAVNHTRRWAPDIQRLKQEFEKGAWGEVRCAHGIYNKGVLNNGSHMVDLLSLLFGHLEVEEVGTAVHDFWSNDPTIPASLRTKSGMQITLSAAHAADYAVFELQIITERGLIQMEDGGLRWRVRLAEESAEFQGYRTLAAAESSTGEVAHAMTAAVANIFEALNNDTPLMSDGRSALQAQILCEQILDRSKSKSKSCFKSQSEQV